jgi:hypothetical protein
MMIAPDDVEKGGKKPVVANGFLDATAHSSDDKNIGSEKELLGHLTAGFLIVSDQGGK